MEKQEPKEIGRHTLEEYQKVPEKVSELYRKIFWMRWLIFVLIVFMASQILVNRNLQRQAEATQNELQTQSRYWEMQYQIDNQLQHFQIEQAAFNRSVRDVVLSLAIKDAAQ